MHAEMAKNGNKQLTIHQQQRGRLPAVSTPNREGTLRNVWTAERGALAVPLPYTNRAAMAVTGLEPGNDMLRKSYDTACAIKHRHHGDSFNQ